MTLDQTPPDPGPQRPARAGAVTAILVSHDGERWLPAVVEGLAEQSRQPDRVVAIDTGSKDRSAELVAASLEGGPESTLLAAPGDTSYPEAVRRALEAAGDAEWIWLLHDDSRPAPGALEALLAAAEAHPDADVLGPKLREWPSLRRLLEVGVTISGTGRRETGLERGEYDQGQHDDVRRVLAVNTAGMLIRRSVLDRLGGLDPELPVFGNDLDLGWRATAAGHRILVVPDAVVFHAEAAHRGVRRTHLTGRHTHYAERRAALFTLLANCRRGALPFLWLRLLLGTMIRAVGLVLSRRVGQALDEIAALLTLYTRPGEIRRGRRLRHELHAGDQAAVRRLLAPWWLPYRHGLDVVTDAVTALTHQAQDVAERRRSAQIAAVGGARAIRSDEDAMAADTGVVARFLLNPAALVAAVFVLLALVGAREALGTVVGGGLAPVPDSVGAWWRLHVEDQHALGLGTGIPAPPYVVVLALLGTLLGGSAGAAVSAIMLLAVPVALWGAWRFLRVVGHLLDPRGAPRWVLGWGATSYALLVVVTGAWGAGRFGTVVVAALLPWLAHAALGFVDPSAERRWRAAWRSGLLLAVASCFVPLLWCAFLLLAVVMLAIARVVAPSLLAARDSWVPPLVALAVPPVLLLPWWLPLLLRGGGRGMLLESGRLPGPDLGTAGLLLGRLPEAGAPWWLAAITLVLAILALVPASTRVPVLACWLVAAVMATGAAAVGWIGLDLPSGPEPVSLSAFMVPVQGALVVAVVLAAQGVSGRVPAPGRPPARALVLPLALAAVCVPVVGLGWFVLGSDQLDGTVADEIPAYMHQEAETGQERGILVLRGSVGDGLDYTVDRGDGSTLGEDEILALAPRDPDFDEALRRLVAHPSPELTDTLAGHGIRYLLMPAPADGEISAVLDATGGLAHASAEDRSTRAWQVEAEPSGLPGAGDGVWWRWLLLGGQLVAFLVILVLAGPSRREELA